MYFQTLTSDTQPSCNVTSITSECDTQMVKLHNPKKFKLWWNVKHLIRSFHVSNFHLSVYISDTGWSSQLWHFNVLICFNLCPWLFIPSGNYWMATRFSEYMTLTLFYVSSYTCYFITTAQARTTVGKVGRDWKNNGKISKEE